MAFDISVDEVQNIIRVVNSGVRTAENLEKAVDIVERQFEKNGPVGLLVDWSEFQGQPDLVPGLLNFAANLSLMVNRAAFLAGEEMDAEVARWQTLIEEVPIRRFSPADNEIALQWLVASDKS